MNSGRRLIPKWALLLIVSAAPVTAAETKLAIRDAWIAEAPPTVQVNAGYMVIENNGDSDRVLESVSSPAFERVEMHRTVVAGDGTSTMQKQQNIVVPAGGKLEFSPGGYHLMLFTSREPVRRGDTIDLTLKLSDGTLLDITASVHRMKGHQHH